MLNIAKESKLGAAEAIRRAVSFFGPDGLGLTVVEQGDCCARFEGGGGFVSVAVEETEGKKRIKVSVQGREWESNIKEFMAKL